MACALPAETMQKTDFKPNYPPDEQEQWHTRLAIRR